MSTTETWEKTSQVGSNPFSSHINSKVTHYIVNSPCLEVFAFGVRRVKKELQNLNQSKIYLWSQCK